MEKKKLRYSDVITVPIFMKFLYNTSYLTSNISTKFYYAIFISF